MSNIGKLTIQVPQNVMVNFDSKNSTLQIKGLLGELTRTLKNGFKLNLSSLEETKSFTISSSNKKLWGTENTHIQNMIQGVTYGFRKDLKLIGIGYRARLEEKKLILKVGYTHDVSFNIPEGILIQCPKPDQITVFGIEKELVHKTSFQIRSIKKPDIYKGKGIRFDNEIIRLKEGKKK
jgi:large subunit ribosomal protein L6